MGRLCLPTLGTAYSCHVATSSPESGHANAHTREPLCGPGVQQALLGTQAIVMLWLGATDVMSVPVAAGTLAVILACVAVPLLRPDVHDQACVAGLLASAGALGWTAVRADVPALFPAVLLTAVVGVVILAAHLRRPQADDIEAELAARVDELARTKDQLLAVVSHEFRTPVTGVMGFAKTMSNHFGNLDQDTMKLFVRSIEEHSTRLARLVDNLVVAADDVHVDPGVSCDIHRVITSVVSTAADSSHDIQVSLRGTRLAQIDESAARRVVTNLLDNAIKFADTDTLIRVDARPMGNDVVIDVVNAGPPLPADLRQRLYQPFVQADSSDSRRADGLGLGLHVVRQLVEAHGGRIELVEGGGLVTFRVRLHAAAKVAGAASPSALIAPDR